MCENTDEIYVIEFDYWGDIAGTEFVFGLYGGYTGVWLDSDSAMCGTGVRHARVELSSSSGDMANAGVFLAYYQDSGSVYITNVRFYNEAAVSDTNPFRYCGEYYDGETGTLYLRARYYDPRIGRFTQEDPVGAGLNWYTYCNGNPIGFFDPWGLAAVNIVDYAKAMGGTVEYYTNNDGKQCVHVTANGVTQSYTYYNSGNIDDTVLNARFGWDSFLTEADRAIEVGIYIFHGDLLKDFTIPINAALDITTAEANRRSQDFFGTGPLDYIWFILQVAPDADWDIKRPDSWNRTIGKNTYPGFGVQVWYQNWVMKPEELGNYTYGYIGAGLNLSLDMLYTGSFWAAGGPLLIFDIDKFIDEMYTDRHMIRRGFNRYHGK